MRLIVLLLLLLSLPSTSFADDPLETLNTVEDAVSTMQHTLQANRDKAAMEIVGAPAAGGEGSSEQMYFVSDEPLGDRGWVAVAPCAEEGASARSSIKTEESGSCGAASEGTASSEGHLWKSRMAAAADLRPGVMVIAKDKARDGEWVLAKITDVSEIGNGYVSITAPFKAHLKNLRVVEE